jgi:hypothetical protein
MEDSPISRIYDTTCGDIYNTSTMMQYWDTFGSTNGSLPARVISSEPGASGDCIVIDQLTYSDFGFIRKNLPSSYSRLIMGMRFKYSALPILHDRSICLFYDSFGVALMDVRLSPDGSISCYQNSVLVVGSRTDAGLIHGDTWAHLGIDVTFSTTSGSLKIYINSVARRTLTGVVTAANANNCSMLSAYRSGGDVSDAPFLYIDDLYVNDSSGASPANGWQGDIEGIARLPNAVGQYTEWSIGGSAPAATNWQSVNQSAPDGDITYVSAASNNLRDTYKVAALPANVAQIVSVTTALNAKTDAAGLAGGASVAPLIGDGATVAAGTAFNLNTSYAYTMQYYGTNPVTSAAWVLADWTSVEVGIKRIT